MTPPGKAINPQNTSDQDVLIGEVHESTVNVLNTVITNVYKPFIEKLTVEDWGNCDAEDRKEFMTTYSRFTAEIIEAIHSLKQNVVLAPFNDKSYGKDAADFIAGKPVAKQKEMVDAFEKLFNEWYEQIEAHLDDSED
jgi:dynein heavy chain